MSTEESSPSYTALAQVYDAVMDHVDYWAWSIYLIDIMDEFAPDASSMLELGCGTGSLAMNLVDLIDIEYAGFDLSPQMIAVASGKKSPDDNVEFYVDDFISFNCDKQFDVVILLYDGLNYLTDEQDIRTLIRNVQACMHEQSIFVFDLSTPVNSVKNASSFEDYGKGDDFSYYRTSEYDSNTMLHRTEFKLELGGDKFSEVHLQRAYTVDVILNLLESEGMETLHAFGDFTFDPANDRSERVHFVTRLSR